MSKSKLLTLCVTQPLPQTTLTRLKPHFSIIHYHPHPEPIPSSILPSINVIFSKNIGLDPKTTASNLQSFERDLPDLKLIQLASAGADGSLRHEIMNELKGKGNGKVKLCTASGAHVLSIPPWCICMIINMWQQIPRMISIQRNEKRWASGDEVDQSNTGEFFNRNLRGRTAGMLGYGQLGRETARLLKSHGMRIIACNSSGKRTNQDGYVIPGTGDKDGSIPETYYSAKDPKSLEEFLKECDVLVASLPNTAQTRYLLDARKLGLMKDESLFLNVGRGSLISSDELIKALDSPKLFGTAIDVTDPEPLPTNHPLWSHPKCLITPHLSGDTEGEFDIGADILLENVKRLNEGKDLVNVVDVERGY